MRLILSTILVALLPVISFAADANPERPRIGLVLGGGGAKGGAHIGVLKVLEKYRVPVDAIAGTSMGSIVSALYATGHSADEIDQITRAINWVEILDDKTERRRINFRRKQDDQDFLTDFKLSFQDGKLILPEGVFQGQKLFIKLSELFAGSRTSASFDDLSIPYRAVAANLETGEAVVMEEGDLATAVFASMAVPGAIPPVERDGLLLVDGGIANNLPIDVARSMGVDIVIVVDIGARMKNREEIVSFLDVVNQMILKLGSDTTKAQLATLAEGDVLIQPELGEMTGASFDKLIPTIEAGHVAAEAVSTRLTTLGLSEESWREHLAARKARKTEAPVIEFVEVHHDSQLSDDVVAGFIRARSGEPVDGDELREDIADLYGLGSFDRITYSVLTENGRTGLVVQAKENPAQRNYFQFGLLMESDFQSETNFLLGASYTKRNLNRYAGEWRSFAQIGSDLFLGTEFYQPFGSRLNFFVNPSVLLLRGNSLLFEDGSTPIAQIRVDAGEIGLDAGMQLGRWGELRIGGRHARGTVKPRIGDPGFDKVTFDDSYYLVRLDVDTLDRLTFPRSGSFVRAQWIDHLKAMDGEFSFDEIEVKSLWVRSRDDHTLRLGAKLQTTIDADDGSLSGFSLGGFHNLSGLAPGQLSGRHIAYGQAIYYRRLTEETPFLDIPVYVGGSLEAGNAYDEFDDLDFGSLIWTGSVFVGMDTLLGPVYLGSGVTEDGDVATYLFVGQTF